jgi:hypothetical protein
VNVIDNFSEIFLKHVIVTLLAVSMFSLGSGTEIESGYIQVTSTGTLTEEIGFRPDYIEFISAQQIESLDFENRVATNRNCPQNVNGWSEGSVIFDGAGVDKQFSIGAFRNSDSTNSHRVASSTSHVIKSVYTGRNGGQCGELRISVTQPLSSGFEAEIESRYGQYDEIVRYKAYQFPDNMEFEAGMVKISSTGSIDVNTGFSPANIHIRAGQQINGKNVERSFQPNDPEPDNTLGRSKGYATLDQTGNVIDQQSIGTASSSDSTNAHRSIASDNYVLNTAYVGQDGNLFGRLRASITGADTTGFNMQVDDKWSQTDEVFLYRAWSESYYDFDIGYRVINSEGSQSFDTGFEPDAIDIYSEQQIDSINQEVVTPTNSGCANAGGWSNGFYETDDFTQWSMGMGRTSDSQNSHRQGASTSLALNNMYSGQNGGDCGNFEGRVTGVYNSGFTMDFSFDNNFNNNYREEMVYYRAFNFQIAPPQADQIWFTNHSGQHAFTVEANFSEGSNDIDSCNLNVEDEDGNSVIYDESDGVEAIQVDDTTSRCVYDRIRYDDHPSWETKHHNNDELVNLTVNVEASDVDGQSASIEGYNTFPNKEPEINQLSYSNYTSIHGFNVSAEIVDEDSINPEEIESCTFKFSDDDGKSVYKTGSIDYSYGNQDEAVCNYSNINSSMNLGNPPGFEVLEDIDIEVNVTDHHGKNDSMTGTHPVPNSVPNAFDPYPRDGYIVTGDEDQDVYVGIDVTDPEADPLTIYYFNDSGQLIEKVETSTGNRVSVLYPGTEVGQKHDWSVKVGDTYENYSTSIFSFTKTTRFAYRTQPRIDYSYSDVIMSENGTKSIHFIAENRISETKNLKSYISGINASFEQNQQNTIDYEVEGNSEKEFLIRIEPNSLGDKKLVITTENQQFGVNTTTEIPVTVKNYNDVSQTSEVPGIGSIQLLMLLLVSAYLYSARL